MENTALELSSGEEAGLPGCVGVGGLHIISFLFIVCRIWRLSLSDVLGRTFSQHYGRLLTLSVLLAFPPSTIARACLSVVGCQTVVILQTTVSE